MRLQLLTQVGVLVDQPLPLALDHPLQPHRLPDHRGDDAEELRGADVEPAGLERGLDHERADGASRDRHGHGDHAQLLGLSPPFRRPHAERRLLADLGHDHAAAALQHALGQLIERAHAALRAADDALGLRGLALAAGEENQPEGHRMVPFEDLQGSVQAGTQVERAREGLADVDERGQFTDFITARGVLLGGRQGRRGTHGGYEGPG